MLRIRLSDREGRRADSANYPKGEFFQNVDLQHKWDVLEYYVEEPPYWLPVVGIAHNKEN